MACGYPARAEDIEMRMKQGFSVFVINWGEPGFKTIEIGRRAAGRPGGEPVDRHRFQDQGIDESGARFMTSWSVTP